VPTYVINNRNVIAGAQLYDARQRVITWLLKKAVDEREEDWMTHG
jgi:predicted DsbA family dithiol-disulfide isomerase